MAGSAVDHRAHGNVRPFGGGEEGGFNRRLHIRKRSFCCIWIFITLRNNQSAFINHPVKVINSFYGCFANVSKFFSGSSRFLRDVRLHLPHEDRALAFVVYTLLAVCRDQRAPRLAAYVADGGAIVSARHALGQADDGFEERDIFAREADVAGTADKTSALCRARSFPVIPHRFCTDLAHDEITVFVQDDPCRRAEKVSDDISGDHFALAGKVQAAIKIVSTTVLA